MEHWNDELIKKLFELQDKEYKAFHSRLMPNIAPNLIIGIRIPMLRKFAKQYLNDPNCIHFLKTLPHTYYEENSLHAFLLETIKDFDKAVTAVDNFLPYIDNWATCDMMSVKVFPQNKAKMLPWLDKWLTSEDIYTTRYAIKFLMTYYLEGDDFSPEYAKHILSIHSNEYYINMAIAWYYATALSMQWDNILPYIEEHRLDTFIHNKTIQKAIESNRVTKEHKAYLRTLKIPK